MLSEINSIHFQAFYGLDLKGSSQQRLVHELEQSGKQAPESLLIK